MIFLDQDQGFSVFHTIKKQAQSDIVNHKSIYQISVNVRSVSFGTMMDTLKTIVFAALLGTLMAGSVPFKDCGKYQFISGPRTIYLEAFVCTAGLFSHSVF